MKCPECGARSDVLETRHYPAGYTRWRLCHNGHRFKTQEVVVPARKPVWPKKGKT